MEAWYLGDFHALSQAYQDAKLLKHAGKKKFRQPDKLASPSKELAKLVPSFQKISGARKMGACLSQDGNTSRSYQVFLEGVQRLLSGDAA
ncbi:MAG: hypothetical protein WC314_06790 [Vulcanimicrobiota bacterium]